MNKLVTELRVQAADLPATGTYWLKQVIALARPFTGMTAAPEVSLAVHNQITGVQMTAKTDAGDDYQPGRLGYKWDTKHIVPRAGSDTSAVLFVLGSHEVNAAGALTVDFDYVPN